ncbi:MAG TPA: pyridoxamine 5'-phosphate oxidase family protein [Acidimicrobiia bacterium]|nr:pyridoxamine 5'-phosphate oxidase family protein [Acidimicrobiia bacterium]
MDSIPEGEAREFLSKAMVAHIGVVSEGDPYVSPMSFVLDGNRILFRTKPGKRFEAIVAHPTVSIESSHFDNETGDWISVIVRGRAAERTDSETATLAVEMLFEKYAKVLGSPLGRTGFQAMASFPHVVEVSIDEITGMVSGREFSVRTRPGRL